MAALAAAMTAMRFIKSSGRLSRAIGRLLMFMLCAALLGATSFAHAAEAIGERVSFESFDIDPETGQPVVIGALYFRPAIPVNHVSGKTPAVVALHGCGGMYGTAARRDRLTQRHQAMADLLVAEGYAVLFPDSFNPRRCVSRPRPRTPGAASADDRRRPRRRTSRPSANPHRQSRCTRGSVGREIPRQPRHARDLRHECDW